MAVALAQPHRRGSKDPRDPFLESPLGRFISQLKLDRLCFDNALNFAQLVRRVFAAKGVPQPHRDGHRTPDNWLGLSTEAPRHLERELEELEKRLKNVSRSGFSAARQLVIFERETLPEQAEVTASVLRELAAGRAPA
jgi:hypothetical protein